MLKKFGKRCVSIIKSKNKLVIFKICFILLAIEIVRVYLLMPLLIFFVVEPADYKGLKYYENESYLEFEKGEIFIDSFFKYNLVEESDITQFYYIDNYLQDNLIYGKHHDIYILDFDAGKNYEEICDFIITEGTYNNVLNDYAIYIISSEFGSKKDCFFFAINNETRQIRYVLVTEIRGINKDTAIRDIVNVIIRNTTYW